MICYVLAMGKQHLGPHVVVGYGIKISWPGLFITSPDHLAVSKPTSHPCSHCQHSLNTTWLVLQFLRGRRRAFCLVVKRNLLRNLIRFAMGATAKDTVNRIRKATVIMFIAFPGEIFMSMSLGLYSEKHLVGCVARFPKPYL